MSSLSHDRPVITRHSSRRFASFGDNLIDTFFTASEAYIYIYIRTNCITYIIDGSYRYLNLLSILRIYINRHRSIVRVVQWPTLWKRKRAPGPRRSASSSRRRACRYCRGRSARQERTARGPARTRPPTGIGRPFVPWARRWAVFRWANKRMTTVTRIQCEHKHTTQTVIIRFHWD